MKKRGTRRAATARPHAAPAARRSVAKPPEPVAVPMRSPWMLLAIAGAAACMVFSASYALYDTDLWQHLAMGRAIWTTPGALHANLWTWPGYGEPYFLSSWGFRALLWPCWTAAGVAGLFVWRWVSTLAVFALAFATARTMGARGLSAIVVMVWCSVGYRLRTDVRPETLAAVWFALVLWLLERARQRVLAGAPPGRSVWWFAVVAWAWANVHISYYLGFLMLSFHLADAVLLTRRRGAPGAAFARTLGLVALVSAAVSFLNPFGWTALAQPFEFAFRWRNDPLMSTIAELQPLGMADALRYGIFLWPILALWRLWRRGVDLVELLACGVFTALGLSSWRFVALTFVAAAPYVARDLHELIVSRRWSVPRVPVPLRALVAVVVSVAICLPEWARPGLTPAIRLEPGIAPEAACDFMAAHGVRGRGFNHTHFGGYLAWRFPSQPDRLPFISTQPEYSAPEDRAGYVEALLSAEGWRSLDRRHRFDWALLERTQLGADSLLDHLDREPGWRMVFSDDAATLLVRADGPLRAVVDSFGYRILPAGRMGRAFLSQAAPQDSALRQAVAAELDRMIAASPQHAAAAHLRGWLAMLDGDLPLARRHLEDALAIRPDLRGVRDMLGSIAYREGRPRDAALAFEEEVRRHETIPGIYFRLGASWAAAGDVDRARSSYRRELARNPGHPSVRDSLAALESRR